MKRFLQRVKSFFLPPEGTPLWIRLLPYGALGILTLFVLYSGAYAWDYTNSPQFCGTSCHTMPPEFTAYLTSPHARIDCVDCHIGKGFIAERITRKAGDAKHIVSLAFRDYEFPIRAHELRPARETCEKCHFPEKFSDDSLREIKRFQEDLANTPTSIYLTLKTGGGSKRQGLGQGIHWHIENPVLYLPVDPEKQEIPFIRVVNDDGTTTDYVDIESNFDPSTLNLEDLEEMDCITCHNRITHQVLTPADTVDQLMARGEISSEIPEIRRLAAEVYGAEYPSNEMGLRGIEGLSGYYQTYHPDFYAQNQGLVDEAILTLQGAYRNSVFPEQKSDWTTHPDNIGHQNSPGCFRCHDGQHLNQAQEAIRLECNLCHSIPTVAGPDDFVTEIEISRGPEPQSHLNPNWISLHRDVFDMTCENCHTTGNPGGDDDSSFCSNSACHSNVYTYAGFDAPGLRNLLLEQLPTEPTPTAPQTPSEETRLTFTDTVGPILETRCGSCHGPGGLQGLNLTDYDEALAGGVNGAVILAGDAQGSLLIEVQSGEQPHFSQFTSEELDLVKNWINAGAPEN